VGGLRHRITIQKSTTAPDDYGQPIETWDDFATVWAERNDLTGREQWSAQQIQAEITTRFRIRYLSGISPLMRVVHGAETFEIVAPPQDPDGRRRDLHLLCKRVVI
jgi:SPP1 family predicted phage head-tail adaptor